jgi:adenosyl cobinamide kinase/adenosyl cobinamide phosphate guanylyltransferase
MKVEKHIERELKKWNEIDKKEIKEIQFHNDDFFDNLKTTIRNILFFDKKEVDEIGMLKRRCEKLERRVYALERNQGGEDE